MNTLVSADGSFTRHTVSRWQSQPLTRAFTILNVGGIAGMLAAGLLVATGARRLQQRRKRAKGERIALPDPEIADLELEMRMVENPIGVADVDNALRTLQMWAEDNGEQLPELLAVRVADDEVALYLAAPADLPGPFESMHEDGTAWVVCPGMAQAPDRPTVSPYPALATVGRTLRDGACCLILSRSDPSTSSVTRRLHAGC